MEYSSHHRWKLVREGQHGAGGVEELHDLRTEGELRAVVPVGVVQKHVDVEEALEHRVGKRYGRVGPCEIEPAIRAVSMLHSSRHLFDSHQPRLYPAQMSRRNMEL